MARLSSLAVFFASTSLLLAGALAWSLKSQLISDGAKPPYDQDIVFPIKTFLSTDAYVAAKGTLTADWIAYKNNTYSILCLPEECIVASVEQIGPKQISSID